MAIENRSRALAHGESWINGPMAPPLINRSNRGSATAPPLSTRGSFNQETRWQNVPTAPPTGWLMKRETYGISKQPICDTS